MKKAVPHTSRARSSLKPSTESLEMFTTEVGKVIKIIPNREFKRRVKILHAILRYTQYVQNTSLNLTAMRAEINRLHVAVGRLHSMLEHQSKPVRDLLISESLKFPKEESISSFDPIFVTYGGAKELYKLCNQLKAALKPQKAKNKKSLVTRDINLVAIELARLMHELGFPPTSTKGGAFQKVLDMFLEWSGFPREDTSKIIRHAVKAYPSRPLMGLLIEGKKHPLFTD